MKRRGFFGRTIGALLGAMFPSLFLKKLPLYESAKLPYRYDVLYGTATISNRFVCRLVGDDQVEDADGKEL